MLKITGDKTEEAKGKAQGVLGKVKDVAEDVQDKLSRDDDTK